MFRRAVWSVGINIVYLVSTPAILEPFLPGSCVLVVIWADHLASNGKSSWLCWSNDLPACGNLWFFAQSPTHLRQKLVKSRQIALWGTTFCWFVGGTLVQSWLSHSPLATSVLTVFKWLHKTEIGQHLAHIWCASAVVMRHLEVMLHVILAGHLLQ